MLRSSLVVAALVAVTSSSCLMAQAKPCVGFNDSTNNASGLITARSFAGPGQWAWRYTPAKPKILRGMRVFTGNKFTAGFMRVEIREEDSTTNLPGKILAGGTWRASKSPDKEFQGANFDRPAILKAKTPYWLTWVEIGWSQVPFQATGTMLPAARWSGSSWTKANAPQAAKIQLFDKPLDSAGATTFGMACPNQAGGVGSTFTNEAPKIGNSEFRVEASGLPSGAGGVFIIGAQATFRSLPIAVAPKCWLNADTALLVPTATGTGNVRAARAAGHTWLPLGIPNNTALRGAFVAVQAAAIDAKSTKLLKMVFTNAMRVKVF